MWAYIAFNKATDGQTDIKQVGKRQGQKMKSAHERKNTQKYNQTVHQVGKHQGHKVKSTHERQNHMKNTMKHDTLDQCYVLWAQRGNTFS